MSSRLRPRTKAAIWSPACASSKDPWKDHINVIKSLYLTYLINKHHNVLNANLLRQKKVLPSLRHHTISGSHNKNCSIHLRCANYHVLLKNANAKAKPACLDVISMSRAVRVAVVSVLSAILNMSNINGDASRLLLRSIVNLIISLGKC
ncbi:hypothetical protein E2C01_005365 [Portunus trituberculatus]|uniref:Uncharacterized protein n=1 Tax=Portunus trituberculatus TaxID=210409 RepID=A0A5B7CSL2_PORTR|nr:hypothetical protein [Portunus trituberculatus]